MRIARCPVLFGMSLGILFTIALLLLTPSHPRVAKAGFPAWPDVSGVFPKSSCPSGVTCSDCSTPGVTAGCRQAPGPQEPGPNGTTITWQMGYCMSNQGTTDTCRMTNYDCGQKYDCAPPHSDLPSRCIEADFCKTPG